MTRENILQDELDRIRGEITPPDLESYQAARARWNQRAKPIGGLGLLEDIISHIAGLIGRPDVDLSKKLALIFCGDHGVTARGVTQTGQNVTRIVADEIARGRSSVCQMAKIAGCEIQVIDMGMTDAPDDGEIRKSAEISPDDLKSERGMMIRRAVGKGTNDFTRGPAMSREQALQAIRDGMEIVKKARERGYNLIAVGEMGIGNTTAASAITAVLCNLPARDVTGRGAGLDDAGLKRKVKAVEQGILINQPDRTDIIDIISKIGGFELAGMCGAFLGAAAYQIPALIDGFPSAAAALCAVRFCPAASKAIFASHVSAEPAGKILLDALEKSPLIRAGMRLGEGTGAVAAMPLLDMALSVYQKCYAFQDAGIPAYQDYWQI